MEAVATLSNFIWDYAGKLQTKQHKKLLAQYDHRCSPTKRSPLESISEENGDSDFLDPKKRLQPRWSSTGHNKLLAPKFFRDPCRQSLGNRPDMFKWFEAQERQEERFKDVSGFCHF